MKQLIPILLPSVAIILSITNIVLPTSVSAQASGFCYTFSTNLGEGRNLSSADALALTTVLSDAGLWNANTPITTYNDQVASAVSGFQEKYASEILTPDGLSYGTGFVGAATRVELNSLYGCQTASGPISPGCPAGYTCTPISQPTQSACPAGYTCTLITNTSGSLHPSSNSSNPTITSVGSPANAPNSFYPGDMVTITGTGFNSNSSVWIGSVSIPGSVNSSGTNISFYAPATLIPGQYNLYVAGPASQSNSAMVTVLENGTVSSITQTSVNCASGQSWDGPLGACVGGTEGTGVNPIITSVGSPANTPGSFYPGDMVTITGSGFTSNSSVWIDSVSIPGSVNQSGKNISFYAPASLAAGQYSLSVTGLGVESNTVQVTVLSINPSASNATTQISLTQTYTDPQLGITLQYPSSSSAGDISLNSVTAFSSFNQVDTNGCYVSPQARANEALVTVNGLSYCSSSYGSPGAGTLSTDYYYTANRNGAEITIDYSVGSLTCGALEGEAGFQPCVTELASDTSSMLNAIQQSLRTLKFSGE